MVIAQDSSGSGSQAVVEESSPTKKKRTRRKPRNKRQSVEALHLENSLWKLNPKPNETTIDSPEISLVENAVHQIEDNLNLLTVNIDFNIRAVTNHSCGKLYRKKQLNKSCNGVNLQYLSTCKPTKKKTDTDKLPSVISQLSNISLSTSSETNQDGVSKRKKRKKKQKEKVEESCLPSTSILENSPKQTTQMEKPPSQDSKPSPRKVSPSKKNQKEARKRKEKNTSFEDYWPLKQVVDGLKSGELVKGPIRINPKNYKVAYVSNNDNTVVDYVINSLKDRNRALEGDEVVLKCYPEEKKEDGQKTARVVAILKMEHTRVAVGKLKPIDREKEKDLFANVFPRDKRLPIIKVPSLNWPPGFRENPKLYENQIFLVKIISWSDTRFAIGFLMENLGQSGDLKAETVAILKELCPNSMMHFSPEMKQYLPQSDLLRPEWLLNRLDIRSDCIFTIDPATAKDLDDAVSCRELPNGNLLIGVHIADASFFLAEGTPLDQMVSQRATSVYLVDSVYHMLPMELCFHCSLLPGKDKLAFSVFWEFTKSGDVVDTRFYRTVINSCAQLSYEHAQMIIDNPEAIGKEHLPQIVNGYSPADIKKAILNLQDIATILRKRRFENGSLRIDQVKLSFALDPNTGKPLGYEVYENKEANRLIEEFMLLANMTVAEKLIGTFPEIAFLRLHEPPKFTMLNALQAMLDTVGIHVDISSSKSIHSSLMKYATADYLGKTRTAVLNHLLTKPMTRARYFCVSTKEDNDFSHYALSVPLYTHFTSPIRRYADIIVHRLLAAALGYRPKPNWAPDFVTQIAENCNRQKYNAKKAGEASSNLYLAEYIEKNGPMSFESAVVDVRESSFDVLVLETGLIVRLYFDKIGNGVKCKINSIPCTDQEKNNRKIYTAVLEFPATDKYQATTLVIETFSLVQIELERVGKKVKFQGKLLRPVN